MSLLDDIPDGPVRATERQQQALATLIFLWLTVAIELRLNVSPHVLNLFIRYTGEGGRFWEKLHPGTLAIFAILPIALIVRPFVLKGSEITLFKSLMTFSAIMVGLMAYLGLRGHAGAAGFLIDAYLVAGAAGLALLTLPVSMRRTVGDVTVFLLVVSAAMGFLEAVTRHHFLPYEQVFEGFRPIGLSMHPLALGAASACAIGFAAVAQWRLWVRILAILVLFIGCAASTARTALVLASVEIFILLLFVRWPRLSLPAARQAKLIAFGAMLFLGAMLLAILFASGFLDRFSKTIFDESFMARVTIYRVFEFFSWRDLFWGVDIDRLMKVVTTRLKLDYIESAPVVLIMLFGIPAALVFTIALVRIVIRLMRGVPMPALLGAFVCIIAALSNNTLTTKTQMVLMFFVLLIAYRKEEPMPFLNREAAGAGRQPLEPRKQHAL